MDKKNLLVTTSIRFNYDAAFLFYDLKGIVAEKWGHSYFNSFRDNLNSFLIENKLEKKLCNYGVKATEIFLEGLSYNNLNKEIPNIKKLINDIINSIKIVKITNFEIKNSYLYNLDMKIDLFDKINNKFVKLKDFFPELSEYKDIGLAFTFQINKFENTFMFGPYSDSNKPIVFRYELNKIVDNALLLTFSSIINKDNFKSDIQEQFGQIDRIIDSNISLGEKQLVKILSVLDIDD